MKCIRCSDSISPGIFYYRAGPEYAEPLCIPHVIQTSLNDLADMGKVYDVRAVISGLLQVANDDLTETPRGFRI